MENILYHISTYTCTYTYTYTCISCGFIILLFSYDLINNSTLYSSKKKKTVWHNEIEIYNLDMLYRHWLHDTGRSTAGEKIRAHKRRLEFHSVLATKATWAPWWGLFVGTNLSSLDDAIKVPSKNILKNLVSPPTQEASSFVTGITLKNCQKLEHFKKHCNRIVCGLNCDYDVFDPLNNRREKLTAKAFEKIIYASRQQIQATLSPHRLLRTGHFFQTNRRTRSFFPYGTKRWNSLHAPCTSHVSKLSSYSVITFPHKHI